MAGTSPAINTDLSLSSLKSGRDHLLAAFCFGVTWMMRFVELW
jgi:hypothetical protein